MQVAGVGNGSQECNYKINLPIAIPTSEGTQLHSITSPTVEGTGANLPGLLGLDSLRANRCMLDMDKAQLIFPGPGDIKYDLPPGSTIVPLEVAPSGHLVMVTDDYGRLPKETGGIRDSKLVMIARTPVAAGQQQAAERLPPVPPVSEEWTEAMRHADGRDTYWTPETWGGQYIGQGNYVFPPSEFPGVTPPRAPVSDQFCEAMRQTSDATYVFPETGDGTARSSRDTRATGSSSPN